MFVGIPASVVCARTVAPLAVRLSDRIGKPLAILITLSEFAASVPAALCVLYFATFQLLSPLLYIMTTLGIWISVPVLFGTLYHMIRLFTYTEKQILKSQPSNPAAKPKPVMMFCTVCDKDRCFDDDERCVECNWFV